MSDDDFASGGVFAGSGFDGYETAETTAEPSGVAVRIDCRRCGATCNMAIEYPELVAVAHGVSPQAAYGQHYERVVKEPVKWAWSQRDEAWHPDVRCPNCRGFAAPIFTSAEAREHVIKARTSGWIDERLLAQLSAASQAAKNAGRR